VEEAARDEAKRNINSFKQSLGGATVKRYNYQKACSKPLRLAKYFYQLVRRR